MQEIDLGDEIQINVKYKGKAYVLREPTVDEIEGLSVADNMKVSEFLVTLGLPVDVVKGMGASKAKTLIETMMDLVTKKK